MPTVIDISRTLSPATAVWPGDTPLTIRQQYSLAAGEMVNLTELTVTAHAGTHIDAPWHTEPGGVHPADLDLALYFGPARVVSISREHGGIVPEDFAGADLTGVERLLIHTWYSRVPDDRFDEAFPYPTPALIDWLADQGVRL
ncbi:MAG: cyclase family protein, partial [Anaerolineae bacterium]|nr:cyclase family protein [Anaerolineae bacterium]